MSDWLLVFAGVLLALRVMQWVVRWLGRRVDAAEARHLARLSQVRPRVVYAKADEALARRAKLRRQHADTIRMKAAKVEVGVKHAKAKPPAVAHDNVTNIRRVR